VDVLTRTAYSEHEIPDSPVLEASGQGWNAEGMHQCDELWTGTTWLAAVDGLAANQWNIGIYTRWVDPAGVAPTAATPMPLRTYPNPARAGQEVRLVLDVVEASRPVGLEITDAGGRSVHRISPTGQIAWQGGSGSPVLWSWVTRDEGGRALSPGVYFVRTTTGQPGLSPHTKVVLTR
jgi:hypothetical protein